MASAYDKASLVMLPNAYKDGKVYSVKPEDRSGDFTFTRPTAATRVDVNGLIEKGRENLLTQSNTFSSSDWNDERLVSPIQTGFTGYDGLSDAWKLIPTTENNSHRISQLDSQTGVKTFSVYLKQAGYSKVRILGFQGDNNIWDFDIDAGVTITNPSYAIEYKATDLGNDWWRLQLTSQEAHTAYYVFVLDDLGNIDFAGDGTSGVLIQDAQLEQSLVATDYIETGASTAQAGITDNVPRLDYSNGATCPSLLLEPQRTNLVTGSEYYSGLYGGQNGSVSQGETGILPISPTSGTIKYVSTAVGFNQLYCKLPASITIGTTYTQQGYVKCDDAPYIFFQIHPLGSGNLIVWDNVNNIVISADPFIDSYNITSLSDGWVKAEITYTATSASIYASIKTYFSSSSEYTQTGVPIGTIAYQALLQVEAGSYPTSYIPTYGSIVSRVAETCGDAGDANTFNSTEGVLYAEIEAFEGSDDTFAISLSDGSSNNRIFLSLQTPESNYRVYSTGGGDITFQGLDAASLSKVAVRYSLNNFSLWVNGVKRGETLSYAGIPANTLNNLSFDRNGAGELGFYGNVKQVLTFNTALSDAELAALTTI